MNASATLCNSPSNLILFPSSSSSSYYLPPSNSDYFFPTLTTTSTSATNNLLNNATNFITSSSTSRCRSLVIEGEISPEANTTTTTTSTAPNSSVAARRLILLRHAQSSWENPSVRDHDRPLSKAGRADAITVSGKLQQLGWVPQLILSSDAARTRETLKIMQEKVVGFLEAEVHFISSFYSIAAMDGQTAEHLQQAISKYSTDDILTVMCMGHNRGWEEAASMLSGASIELKTCNAALLEARGKSWDEAFSLAGVGGWKLHGIVKPNSSL